MPRDQKMLLSLLSSFKTSTRMMHQRFELTITRCGQVCIMRYSPVQGRRGQLGAYEGRGEQVGPLVVDQAGWHCSWCFHPRGIRRKLLDAPRYLPHMPWVKKKTEITDFTQFPQLSRQSFHASPLGQTTLGMVTTPARHRSPTSVNSSNMGSTLTGREFKTLIRLNMLTICNKPAILCMRATSPQTLAVSRSRLRNDSGVTAATDPGFAPPYMISHVHKYTHLLTNPYS